MSAKRWDGGRGRPIVAEGTVAFGCGVAAVGLYHLVVLAAAALAQRSAAQPHDPAGDPLRLAALVPAHDEEHGVARTVASLLGQEYPAERREVIVLADNCSDSTSAAASAAGATVWERNGGGEKGKGRTLAWAIDRLGREQPDLGGVVVVDADCQATPNLLVTADHALRSGAVAVQVRNSVANEGAGVGAGLRAAAFRLLFDIGGPGRERLGLSCGLHGTGMALAAPWLAEHPWDAYGITEDREFHLRLVESGERVHCRPEAEVSSDIPPTLSEGDEQRLRWEQGRAALIPRAARLAAAGLRRRDRVRLGAAIDLLLPSQSLWLTLNVAGAAAATVARSRTAQRLALANLALQGAWLLGGLSIAGAPAEVWRSLLGAPALVARNALMLLRLGADDAAGVKW